MREDDLVPPHVRRLFRGSKRLRISHYIAYQAVMDGQLLFGTKNARGQHSLEILLHEMAHFVEIDEARMSVNGWGLSMKPARAPRRSADVRRELRVLAFEMNITRALCLDVDVFALASVTIPTLPGWKHFWAQQTPSDRRDKRRCIRRQVKALARQPRYSFDAFSREWHKRRSKLEAEPWRLMLPYRRALDC